MVDAFAIKTVTVTINGQDFTGTATAATGSGDAIVIEVPYALKGKTATFKAGTAVNTPDGYTVAYSGWPGTAPAIPTASNITVTATASKQGQSNVTATASVSISMMGAVAGIESVPLAGWFAYKKVKVALEYVTSQNGVDLRAALGKYLSVREVIGIQGGDATAFEFDQKTGKLKLYASAGSELSTKDIEISLLILE